ncbi:hypothetical protein ARMSODRAFT_448881 [Armillaria solidipes]|uniref:Uncharacterized protein n=1 Tax=Armillaria solidipes TaxID=1076256 RepID=A0A2H3BD45_9AGAR|nr:hypothetical protein ARMSODRAFT_448881 [Armillaria solidipes]
MYYIYSLQHHLHRSRVCSVCLRETSRERQNIRRYWDNMSPKLAKMLRSERFIEGRGGVIWCRHCYDDTRLNWNVTETEGVDETRNDLGPEGEQWRLRHYAYIFPNLTVKETEDRKLDCERNVLRPKENITESRVRRREQIKYEHVARCIPGLDVYNITNACQVLQYFYTHGEKPVIPTSLADTPCVDLLLIHETVLTRAEKRLC